MSAKLTVPDDTAALQQVLRAVLLQQSALHAENDKLRLLIQRLTRHQFGRRSEQLSPDQLQLGLEGPRANHRRPPSGTGGADARRAPALRRAVGAQPPRVAGASAALRGGGRYREPRMSVLRRRADADRRAPHRLANWVGRACWWLQPLYDLLVGTVLSSPPAAFHRLKPMEPG